MSEWQPIETAPKDGTYIVVSDGVRVSLGLWVSDVDQGADYEGQIGMAGWWSVDLGAKLDRPTHWMPLPDPPATQGSKP